MRNARASQIAFNEWVCDALRLPDSHSTGLPPTDDWCTIRLPPLVDQYESYVLAGLNNVLPSVR